MAWASISEFGYRRICLGEGGPTYSVERRGPWDLSYAVEVLCAVASGIELGDRRAPKQVLWTVGKTWSADSGGRECIAVRPSVKRRGFCEAAKQALAVAFRARPVSTHYGGNLLGQLLDGALPVVGWTRHGSGLVDVTDREFAQWLGSRWLANRGSGPSDPDPFDLGAIVKRVAELMLPWKDDEEAKRDDVPSDWLGWYGGPPVARLDEYDPERWIEALLVPGSKATAQERPRLVFVLGNVCSGKSAHRMAALRQYVPCDPPDVFRVVTDTGAFLPTNLTSLLDSTGYALMTRALRERRHIVVEAIPDNAATSHIREALELAKTVGYTTETRLMQADVETCQARNRLRTWHNISAYHVQDLALEWLVTALWAELARQQNVEFHRVTPRRGGPAPQACPCCIDHAGEPEARRELPALPPATSPVAGPIYGLRLQKNASGDPTRARVKLSRFAREAGTRGKEVPRPWEEFLHRWRMIMAR